MKKYPYIGQQYSAIILFYAENKGLVVGDALGLDESTEVGDKVELPDGTNITREYLLNTWGVVESKEHAEFIVELAENIKCAGVDICKAKASANQVNGVCFNFYIDSGALWFSFSNIEMASNRGEKQITIPLPPKAKEWVPEVGDRVLICNIEPDSRLIEFNNEVVSVLAKTKDSRGEILTISHPLRGIGAIVFFSKFAKKPKTKEDLLTEELQAKLCNNNYVDNFTLASDIINGMIPGLSYNSDIESAVKGVINKNLDGDA